CVFARIDRRRKLPVTILLRALGYNDQEILDLFFDKNVFFLSKKHGVELELKPERLRGETAMFEIRAGDTVIVESPTYFGMLEALDALHLKALEIATCPEEGIDLDELEQALGRERVAAVALIPTFGNPTGHLMPDDAKKRLVTLLAQHRVPLVEDDVYGELPFEGERPKPCRAYDREGFVLYCSSLSKTLSPGLRVGWCAPGRFQRDVLLMKHSFSVAVATPTQMAAAEILRSGSFDTHLRQLRARYHDLVRRVSNVVAERFPDGTRMTRPKGGHVLWIELPAGHDALANEVYELVKDKL
ncbi:MAG: aminotransferase class I/II-fold pyridoxal phosphate-dependent enzyme, partial [Anaerolineales bacterium]|nr:aminotransferase class I/II-fold pyridoxal phosphate-dependent enzyme [Anaerolineales bacterium]